MHAVLAHAHFWYLPLQDKAIPVWHQPLCAWLVDSCAGHGLQTCGLLAVLFLSAFQRIAPDPCLLCKKQFCSNRILELLPNCNERTALASVIEPKHLRRYTPSHPEPPVWFRLGLCPFYIHNRTQQLNCSSIAAHG